MRRIACLLSALTIAAAGCDSTRDCKTGTLLVEAHYPAAADHITIGVSLNGGAEQTGTPLSNPSGATSGTAEIDFTKYPTGATAVIRVAAIENGTTLAEVSQSVMIVDGCTHVSIDLSGADAGAGGGDLAGLDLAGVDLAGCVTHDTPASCGPVCEACMTPAHGSATCDGTTCGFTCAAGFTKTASGCDVAAPRPIFPSSNTYTSGRAPTFEWKLAAGTDGAHLEVCTDRACTNKLHSADATGTTYTPPDLVSTGTLFWRLAGRIGNATGSSYSPIWEYQPLKRTASVKTAWGKISDINGDGFADIVVGDDNALNSAAKGALFVHYGSSSGVAATAATTYSGDAAGGRFANVIALLGDVDGDGYSDVVAGTFAVGNAYFFRGSATGLITNTLVTLGAGATANTHFGDHVAAAGDLNGDGYADLVVGAYMDPHQGAYVFYGSATGLGTTPSLSLAVPTGATDFGYAVAGAGDVNRDGYADLLVGDFGADKVYLYLGSATGVTATPSQTIVSPVAAGKFFGQTLSTAGDVNGDGYADIVIAAPGQNQAWLYKGISTGINATFATALPPSAGMNNFGASVDCAGDVNGDGYTDVLVTESNSTTHHLYTGTAGGLSAAGTSLTTPANAGYNSAGAGDLDGDGYSDIVIGDPTGSGGQCVVFSGTTGTNVIFTDTGVSGRYGVAAQ